MASDHLTYQRVRQLLDYDEDTGYLTWKVSRGSVRAGATAGCAQRNNKGYRLVTLGIDGRLYLASRVIWLWMTGDLPAGQVDHIDGDSTNNKWSNLRAVTNQDNQRNVAITKNNTSGVTGVYWCKRENKWRATIGVGNRRFHLGYFSSLKDAGNARKAADKKYGFHPNHGKRRHA